MNIWMTPRGITDSLTFANEQLQHARQNGISEQVVFWEARIDQLLDHMERKP